MAGRRRLGVIVVLAEVVSGHIEGLITGDDPSLQLFQRAVEETDDNLLRLQTRTPLYLNQEIEAAASIEQLRRVNARMVEILSFAARAGSLVVTAPPSPAPPRFLDGKNEKQP